MIIKYKKVGTSYNRSVYAASAARGSVRLGRSAYSLAPTAHSTHILATLQTQRQGKNGFMPLRLFIRVAKTSYTAGTLCEIAGGTNNVH